MKHWVQFVTMCGCTRLQEWHTRPYPVIVVPITRRSKITWEDDSLDYTLEYRGLPRREFEESSRTELPNGDMVWTFVERPV